MNKYHFLECGEEEWNSIMPGLPTSHFLQTSQWAEIKKEIGWQPVYKIWKGENGAIVGGAMILERSVKPAFLPLSFAVQYIPKGPLLDWDNTALVQQALGDLASFARQRKVIFTKIDPDVIADGKMTAGTEAGTGISSTEDFIALLRENGWQYSASQIQFQNTVLIDLAASEADLLSQMKQKTRYNIRLAEKKGVKIRIANTDEYETVYRLYAETSLRDHFVIRPESYYLQVWESFTRAGLCEILVAEFENELIAGLVLYFFGNKAYYVYGMSANRHRNVMATYLIQWEAIRRAKGKGKQTYDLWGAPNKLNENDPMWGVYRFKLGLGGKLARSIGAWDFPNRKILYFAYERVLPAVLGLMRTVGRKRTQQSLE